MELNRPRAETCSGLVEMHGGSGDGAESPQDVAEVIGAVVETCLKRFRRWQIPPNWAFGDWIKEMAGQGHVAAWEALGQYDATRGLGPATFVMCRVMARCLTRYRQEWAFAGRCEELSAEPGDSAKEWGRRYPHQNEARIWEHQDLVRAVNQLKELDRWILKQLFWEERREEDVAEELGVSQPAVSKRKRTILGKLRRLLTSSESESAACWTPKARAEASPST